MAESLLAEEHRRGMGIFMTSSPSRHRKPPPCVVSTALSRIALDPAVTLGATSSAIHSGADSSVIGGRFNGRLFAGESATRFTGERRISVHDDLDHEDEDQRQHGDHGARDDQGVLRPIGAPRSGPPTVALHRVEHLVQHSAQFVPQGVSGRDWYHVGRRTARTRRPNSPRVDSPTRSKQRRRPPGQSRWTPRTLARS